MSEPPPLPPAPHRTSLDTPPSPFLRPFSHLIGLGQRALEVGELVAVAVQLALELAVGLQVQEQQWPLCCTIPRAQTGAADGQIYIIYILTGL